VAAAVSIRRLRQAGFVIFALAQECNPLISASGEVGADRSDPTGFFHFRLRLLY
jgi:hypothetical protein